MLTRGNIFAGWIGAIFGLFLAGSAAFAQTFVTSDLVGHMSAHAGPVYMVGHDGYPVSSGRVDPAAISPQWTATPEGKPNIIYGMLSSQSLAIRVVNDVPEQPPRTIVASTKMRDLWKPLVPFQQSGETYEFLTGSYLQIDPSATQNVQGTFHVYSNGTLQVDSGATFTISSVPIAPIASAFGSVSFNRAVKIATFAIAGGTDTGGGLGSWVNPEAGTIVIQRCFVVTSVVSTGANTIDVGTTATNATTDSANLITAANAHSALLHTENLTATTGAATNQVLATGKWVTASTTPSTGGTSTGLVGTVYVEYFNE